MGRALEFRALSDIVIIRRLPQAEISEGGIFLVDSKEFLEDIGEVVSAGKGKLSPRGVFIPNEIKEGDKVLFSTRGHQITKLNGTELVVTRQDSIMAVIG